jgi:hypothetical protein
MPPVDEAIWVSNNTRTCRVIIDHDVPVCRLKTGTLIMPEDRNTSGANNKTPIFAEFHYIAHTHEINQLLIIEKQSGKRHHYLSSVTVAT